jgi:hypothetical protein
MGREVPMQVLREKKRGKIMLPVPVSAGLD